MSKYNFVILIALLYCFGFDCFSQSNAKVSDPRPELAGNLLHISYDILNSDKSAYYIISIEVTYPNGTKLNTRTLTGDIGDKVNGGKNKRITWDLASDHVYIDDEILIKISAEVMHSDSDKKQKRKPASPGYSSMNQRRGMIMLQSLVLPGLGLSRYKGGPHWIRGAVGYGCIAGSVYYNRLAVNTYNSYLDQSDTEMAHQYYELAANQDLISEVLAFTAIGIWVADLVWTYVATSDLRSRQTTFYNQRISLITSIDPVTASPLVGMNIRF